MGGEKIGSVESISFDDFTVEIKKRQDSAAIHPKAVYGHKVVGAEELAESLVRLGEHVANNGLQGEGSYQAARDLLLRKAPRLGGEAVRADGETTLAAAVRLCAHLGNGVLPIQGPPGAGKTFTGARMICELVSQGKIVGITANSHKVIRNLIDAVIKAADELGIDLHCCQKAAEMEEPRHRLSFAKRSEDLIQSLGSGVAVGGGTAWLWSRQDAFEVLDVLFVDDRRVAKFARSLAPECHFDFVPEGNQASDDRDIVRVASHEEDIVVVLVDRCQRIFHHRYGDGHIDLFFFVACILVIDFRLKARPSDHFPERIAGRGRSP